jgi:ParB-like chromosome segregation protein Spo0J
MELQTLAIKDLKMPKRMVRKLDEGHIKEVANGIQGMGFSVPVLVGKNNVTIDGASSVKRAEGLGLTEVPCVLLSHLSDDEQRVLRIAIKPGQPKGVWDLDEDRIRGADLGGRSDRGLRVHPRRDCGSSTHPSRRRGASQAKMGRASF